MEPGLVTLRRSNGWLCLTFSRATLPPDPGPVRGGRGGRLAPRGQQVQEGFAECQDSPQGHRVYRPAHQKC